MGEFFLKDYQGFKATGEYIGEYAGEEAYFYGSVCNTTDSITFSSDTYEGLQEEFEAAVRGYISFCEEVNKEVKLK